MSFKEWCTTGAIVFRATGITGILSELELEHIQQQGLITKL